ILTEREFIHHLLYFLSLTGFLPGDALFFSSRFRLFAPSTNPRDIDRVQHEIVLEGIERYVMAAGVDSMLPMLLIPLSDRSGLVHVLDDFAPTDSGVVRAERDLTKLRRIRNDAHFRAAKIIVEQILEPHSCNEQEVPRIAASLLNVVHGSIAAD